MSAEEYADEILENWNCDFWNSELYKEKDRLMAYLEEKGYLIGYSSDELEKISDYFLDSVKIEPEREELIII